MKLLYFFILLISGCVFKAQSVQEKYIDSLMEVSKQDFAGAKFLKSLELANKAQDLSEKIKYSKGITVSNIHIANVLSSIGEYHNAMYFIRRAEKERFLRKDINQQSEINRIRGRIYYELKLYKESIRQYQSNLYLSYKIKDSVSRDISLFLSHHRLATIFGSIGQKDSAWSHLKSLNNILKKFKKKEASYSYGIYYYDMAQQYIYDKDYKNAKTYLDKAMVLYNEYIKFPKLSAPSSKYGDMELAKLSYPGLHVLLNKYGYQEQELGNIDQAESYYLQALSSMIKEGNMGAVRKQYKLLADYYTYSRHDNELAGKYRYKYQKISDSLDAVNKKIEEIVLDDILEFKNDERRNNQRKYVYGVLGVVLLLFLIIIFYYQRHQKKSKLLQEKDIILSEKEILNEELEKKVEENKFQDLIILAKNNNPEFLVLFKEVYPQFISKLKELDPKIRSSELSFCAMAYLNFSTKDISEYTFVTVRAVQIRKNRLRKKYSIPSDEDFNSWMRRLDSSS
ncbi:hypothetical protein BAS10_11925 [Elizabethkingia meningoseptica]|nr:hypothetical protein BAS10_11925 [Elizabethkingia meningoseptica]